VTGRMDGQPPQVVCLLGPTAAGKTETALELARHLPLEIVSVDSVMIYRGMDIGTAKPAAEQLAKAPHHLIDIREPWESYSAGAFARDASALIDKITARGNIPLLVGGTFLYFRALQRGLAPLPAGDPELREELDRRGAAEGWEALHAELAGVDPEAAARINPQDRQRIQRALEVFALSGEPISRLQSRPGRKPERRFLSVVLEPGDRNQLHKDIENRFRQMMRAGFLDEVKLLKSIPQLSGDTSAMRAVGYRQLWRHLLGELNLEQAESSAIVATRRYAKRQLTWLRSAEAELRLDCQQQDVVGPVLEMLAQHGFS